MLVEVRLLLLLSFVDVQREFITRYQVQQRAEREVEVREERDGQHGETEEAPPPGQDQLNPQPAKRICQLCADPIDV